MSLAIVYRIMSVGYFDCKVRTIEDVCGIFPSQSVR